MEIRFHQGKGWSKAGCFVALFFFVTATSVFSDQTVNASSNIVNFFKGAIGSPPDVLQFTLSQHGFEKNLTSYYMGARAGTNFFLQMLSSSNGFSSSNERQLITGRSGTGPYELSQNAVSFGVGSNGLTSGVEILFTLTRQFLDMGFSEISPETVSWSGNSFTAKNNYGNSCYGELSLSNGLPAEMKISNAKGPYKVVKYVYPQPETLLNGFPRKMTISGISDNKLTPRSEIFFYSVQLAATPLADTFFSHTQFLGPGILYTNIYKDQDLYVQNNLGQTVKAPSSVKSGG